MALPFIEQVIRETVEPSLALDEPVGGLKYVLGAYLVIYAKSEPERAVQFFSDVSIGLKIEVLSAICIFFNTNRDGYVWDMSLPRMYIADLSTNLHCQRMRKYVPQRYIR